MKPLTTTDLDEMAARGCGMPLCNHIHDGKVYLTQQCCPVRKGVSVSYQNGDGFVRIVCRCCGKRICEIAVASDVGEIPVGMRGLHHPDPVTLKQPPEWFVGKSIKLPFKGLNALREPVQEFMWVHVEGVDGEELYGTIASTPVYLLEPTAGAGISGIERCDILQISEEEEDK